MVSLRDYAKYLLIAVLYYVGALALLSVFLLINHKLHLISNAGFLNWDARHYNTIREIGYDRGTTAFFPLFPYFWKITGLSAIGIGVVNFVLFLVSISIICAEMRLRLKHMLILLSLPGLFFMFLPYAEALFFLGGTIAILGLKREKLWMTVSGLLVCSLCRPTTFIFIPAVIITLCFAVNGGNEKPGRNRVFVHAAILSVLLVAGLLLSFYIQKQYTGEWFAFFESQEKNWGNKLQLPVIPLTTWGGDNILRYESTAFLIGMVSAVVILMIIFNKNIRERLAMPKYILFSIAYLAGAMGVVLLFRGGILFSLNRFIYATPFVIVALAYFLQTFSFTVKQVLLFFVGFILFSAAFASYSHIHNLLCFALTGAILSAALLVNHTNRYIAMTSTVLLIAANSVLAYHLITKFLSGVWVA